MFPDVLRRVTHGGEQFYSTGAVYVSKQTWCLTSTETVRLIRDGEKGGGGGMEVGEEGDYIPIATLLPPE